MFARPIFFLILNHNLIGRRSHLCGYDLNLTYPQTSRFPTLNVKFATDPNSPFHPSQGLTNMDLSRSLRKVVAQHWVEKNTSPPANLDKRELEVVEKRRMEIKRDLTGRPNNTIDPYYGCFLYEFMIDYANNFTFPWSEFPFLSSSSLLTD